MESESGARKEDLIYVFTHLFRVSEKTACLLDNAQDTKMFSNF